MVSKIQIKKLKNKYGFVAVIASFTLVIMTWLNTYYDFTNNFKKEDNKELLINQRHAIRINSPSFLLYEKSDSILSPLNYISFIEVINDDEKITKLISCKLEIFINKKWVELPLLSKNFYDYNTNTKYTNQDFIYIVHDNDLKKCNKIDFYSFEAQALYNEISPGQSIMGWLAFKQPDFLSNEKFAVSFGKIKYTFKTKQGKTISKIITNHNKAVKLGTFTNKYAAAWSIDSIIYNLSNRKISD